VQLADILAAHGVQTAGPEHRHGRDGWVQVDCPHCGRGSGKYHMGLNTSNGAVNCWQCGRHGLLDTLVLLCGAPRPKLRGLLDGAVFTTNREYAQTAGRLVVPEGVGGLAGVHRQYLQQRGFVPEQVCQLWGVQGIGLAPRLQWRLYIPIHYNGRPVSWTTRSLTNRSRYLSASPDEEAMPHRELLYGADYCRGAVVVCEGPLDVWAIGPGAVATCGLAYTHMQVQQLARYPVRAVCFDNDPAAQQRAQGLADTLALFPGRTENIVLETGEDAASAHSREIQQIRERYLQ
jgi:hypothetical protein